MRFRELVVAYIENELISFWFDFTIMFYKFFGRTYKAKVCGHTVKFYERVTVFKKDYCVSLHGESPDVLEYCQHCAAKMAIRCPYCRQPIFVGDPIALFCSAGSFLMPSWAYAYKEDPKIVVGCLGCADTVAMVQGFWVAPGKVERILSPIEYLAWQHGVFSDVANVVARPQSQSQNGQAGHQ